MQIIPALYIKDGKAAIYSPGNYEDLEYLAQDPYDLIDQLGRYEGIQRIHLVDIDASLKGGMNNHGLIGSLANVSVPDLQVAGGIDDMEHLKSLQYAGADYFVLGSVVLSNFDFLHQISEVTHIKNDRIEISLDVLNGRLTTHGWTEAVDDYTIRSLIRACSNLGFSRFLCTDIDAYRKDLGPDYVFFQTLIEQFPDLIFSAAGNIRDFDDVEALKSVGVVEVVVGDEIYKEEGLLEEISAYNLTQQ